VSDRKIFLEPRDLLPAVGRLRSAGGTLVFANGCFELLHVGHVEYLYAAKRLGDVLLVAVNTDASLRLIKPDRRPANPGEDRMRIVAAIEPVDYVVPLDDRTPAGLIALFRPEFHTKGTDYRLDQIPEREVVESYGGRTVLVGGPKTRSTTDMLRQIRGRTAPALA
jgi:D-beta-D-heptose 7-phosphate kinase/D-beta-D-heptose 1-phosphate adenosyltransferase